jgi:hypothetical protein
VAVSLIWCNSHTVWNLIAASRGTPEQELLNHRQEEDGSFEKWD